MTEPSTLLRQIHPAFIQNGRVISPAFRPTKKDSGRLSVSDGSQITAEKAWRRFTADFGYDSVGILGITHAECERCGTFVHSVPLDYQPDRMEIDFNSLFSSGEKDRAAKLLCNFAVNRGWLFQGDFNTPIVS